MKRILLIALTAVMAFLFSSCSDKIPASTVNSVNDLPGKSIGVIVGSSAAWYTTGYDTIKVYSSGESMIAELKSGLIDCAIADDAITPTLLGFSNNVRALDEPFVLVDFCVVAAKESRDLLQKINKALDELRVNGTITGLQNHYFLGTQYELTVRTDIPKTAGTLHLAVPGDFPPYCFKNDNGEITGFDISLARAICDNLGVNLEIKETTQNDIVKTVWSSRADFGMGGMYKTNANQDLVDFSDGYSQCRLRVITRK